MPSELSTTQLGVPGSWVIFYVLAMRLEMPKSCCAINKGVHKVGILLETLDVLREFPDAVVEQARWWWEWFVAGERVGQAGYISRVGRGGSQWH